MAKLTDNQKSLAILGGGLIFAIGFGVLAYLHHGDYTEVEEDITAKKATHKTTRTRSTRSATSSARSSPTAPSSPRTPRSSRPRRSSTS